MPLQVSATTPLKTADLFRSGKPFPHLQMPSGFFCSKRLATCREAWPKITHDSSWIEYNNSLEMKAANNDVESFSEPLRDLIAELQSNHFLNLLTNWTQIPGLRVDWTLHGAGLHEMHGGDWLQTHGDYEIHPEFPDLERRLNLILFLSPAWKPEYGGALLLCDPMGRTVTKFYPEFGKCIITECGNATFHGVEEIAANAPPRLTVAVYYLAPKRPEAHRMRAMFLPNRNGDGPPDEVKLTVQR